MSDTIFALGSGPAPAGVAVIRLSGPHAGTALSTLTDGRPFPDPRVATLRNLIDPTSSGLLDQGIVLWFPAPNSFTGEDVAELHVHGGAASIQAVLSALSTIPGCRMAEAGEFTRRAFAAGRMNLTEVEGLADLIAAETDAQRRLALRQASGEGADLYKNWTDRLVRILATLEAAVDFPEDDLPEQILNRNEIDIRTLVEEWTQHIELGRASAGIRDGVRVAILGAPNVGKSSLLNRLAGRDAAIVSETAGTTRDVIEVRLDLGGYAVTLSDTAGLRETEDRIEEEGVRRALDAARAADLILYLSDDATVLRSALPNALSDREGDIFLILTKQDTEEEADQTTGLYPISSKTGAGLTQLLERLEEACQSRYGAAVAAVAVRARHREALAEACDALEHALIEREFALAAEDVRIAVTQVGRITGRVDVESILDVVFSEFCIGK
ncbi:tRNA uridine-5-carboxymethylaminomethyl(34) synthesis GTPase MnmE [Rhodospirillaceae bacterium KN72]|uniref:tRNA modification GTPase MnmE n=1 Tax=Pacificispira spongiicola TaxID=2729598 RepID=A0A7Y0HFV7_9PROT|nr:tRNA uridine-5-carboxymethylaminomethyl(34) synthesis GTPase MnmE [Pacificispira spongiicola]NMM45008.1 tRNA uridine-5-carboxymethylaminomethyl(34) synthesis GTPase MnmE [Pacificispira spongiicola]